MQKKKLTLVIVSLLVVVLSVSLAWFTTQIIGKGKNLNVSSANLQIVFTDSDGALTETDIEPGWSATKTFTIKNDTKTEYKYNIVIKDLVNTFVTNGYLQYKITSTNNGYNMTEFKDIPKSSAPKDTILAYSVSIPVGVTQSYTIEFKYANDESVDQSDDMGKKLSGKLFITEGTEQPTLLSQILKDNPTRSTRSNNNNGTNDFATPLTTTTTGTLFTSTESITGITDSPKEVYYYAGNTTNNWVKFAGLYWRIIRTNHDSSIRLLYVGTSHDTTTGNIGESEFNTSYNSPKYVGYKYGEDTSLDTIRNNTTDSTIKTFIDSWYQNNLTDYTKYLSTSAVYCNDRKLASGSTYTAYREEHNNKNLLAYVDKNERKTLIAAESVINGTSFASYERLDTNKSPSYNCTDIRDAFSVDNTSAKLDYPISLMTADEIAFAGGVKGQIMNTPYAWFISNSAGTQVSTSWWSLSPEGWGDGNACVFYVIGSSYDGSLGNDIVFSTNGVRPVVSLKSCVKWASGDGTADNPYTIEETSTGC